LGGEVCGPEIPREARSNKRVRNAEDEDACGDPRIESPSMEVVQYIPIPLPLCTPPRGPPPPPPTGRGERRSLRAKSSRPSVRGPPNLGGSRLLEGPGGLADLSTPELVLEYIRSSDEEAEAESRAKGLTARPRRRTPSLPDPGPDPGSGVGPGVGSADASVSPDARPASGDMETGGDHPEGAGVSVEGTGLDPVSSDGRAEGDPAQSAEEPLLSAVVPSGSKAEDDPVPPTEGPLLSAVVSSCSQAEDDPIHPTEGPLLSAVVSSCSMAEDDPAPPTEGPLLSDLVPSGGTAEDDTIPPTEGPLLSDLVPSGGTAGNDTIPPTEGPPLLCDLMSSFDEAEVDPESLVEGPLISDTLPSAQPPPHCVGEGVPDSLLPRASERGSPGPGAGGTSWVPFDLVQYTTREPIGFYSLEACASSIFESPVVGSAGSPSISCYFGFAASTMRSELSLSPWGTGPSGEGRGPEPAPGDSNSGPPPPVEPGKDPPATDPGGWVGAEVELAGGPGPPVARPASEDPEPTGDRLEEEGVSVVSTGVCLESPCSEAGDSPVPPTERPLIPAGELRAFLLAHKGHRDEVQLALSRWADVALLVRSARAFSRAVPESDGALQRRAKGLLAGLEREQASASCAAASSHIP